MIEIIENKALLVATDYPERITTVIPKSKLVGAGKVLVYWGHDECRVLHNLGFKDTPSIIEKEYKWAGIYTPFAHQRITAGFLSLNKRAYVLNDMGTGKSSSAAWAIDYLMIKGLVKRALIVSPLSIMKSGWLSDLFKTVMHRSVGIAHGSKQVRQRVIRDAYEIVVINFDGVEIVQDALIAGNFDLVVIDEATAYKKAGTKRWKAMNQLINDTTWLWMMTGTPAAQSPMDAYGLVKLMHPNSIPPGEHRFKDTVMYKAATFTWKARPEANTIIHNLMQPAIRFTKEECLDLPPMLYQDREVALTRQQEMYYKKIKTETLAEFGGESITAVNAAVLMQKLLQVAAGAAYTDDRAVIEFDSTPRYNELKSIIEASEHSVIVFCMFKHNIELVASKLLEEGHNVHVVNGRVSLNKRTAIFKGIQEGGKQVLVAQPQSMSHGITLTAADTIVWWSPTTSYETYAQANARIYRAGQDKPCTVVNIQGCEVEKKIYASLQRRDVQQIDLLGLYKSLTKGK